MFCELFIDNYFVKKSYKIRVTILYSDGSLSIFDDLLKPNINNDNYNFDNELYLLSAGGDIGIGNIRVTYDSINNILKYTDIGGTVLKSSRYKGSNYYQQIYELDLSITESFKNDEYNKSI
jgi:hypothetical protein